MFFFNRNVPVEPVIQRPRAELPARTGNTELDMLDLVLHTQGLLPAGKRDLALIDRVLDDRLALTRSMVPVNPGRAS